MNIIYSKLTPRIEDKIEELISEKDSLEESLNYQNPMELKRLTYLSKLSKQWNQYKQLEEQIKNLDEDLSNLQEEDMIELFKIELESLINQINQSYKEMLNFLVDDESSVKDVIIEMRSGAGGDEASLFVEDLFKCYSKFADNKGLQIQINSETPGTHGGYKELIFSVKGENAKFYFDFESGVHRVQRVPKTETKGRTHTSTITVTVLEQVSEIEVDLKPSDYRKDTFKSSGAGGQHVNTTESAVRLFHYETGIVVSSQSERSQHTNFELALEVLKAKIYQNKLESELKEQSNKRLLQIGSGDRSEKIRTYNYPQNRVTDHRIQTSISLEDVLLGRFDGLIEKCREVERELKIESL